MKDVSLGEVASFIRGVTFKPGDVLGGPTESSVGVMRTKNVQAELDTDDILQIPRDIVRREDQYLRRGDVLVSSANSWNLVGRCSWVPDLTSPAAIGGFVTALRATSDSLDSRYLYRWFSSTRTQAEVRNSANQTTNIANLNLKRCEALRIPLPALDEQRRIAAILDRTDALREKRRGIADNFDELFESTFVSAFGTSLRNPTTTLGEIADIASGITKGRKTAEPTKAIPYLAVANVQAGYLNLGQVKEIGATDREIQRHALVAGDIVLTEGGDPDKLGRGTVWREELPLCLHQNHIFRVRIRDDQLHPDYLAAYFASKPAKDYFFRSAKQTTGIASINMTQLRNTPIYVPPQKEQEKYVTRIREISSLRLTALAGSACLDELFASLQYRAFSGQL
ncbi:restriction endonuclease subunit S [Mycolicibacterium sp. Dal123E01]|uniref:restriction endonuclease subunit S n=1 Tax=Mycolicibacterium sp. Dal123E01 TaxID=3457578 RepID=UPI00403E83AD